MNIFNLKRFGMSINKLNRNKLALNLPRGLLPDLLHDFKTGRYLPGEQCDVNRVHNNVTCMK